MDADCDFSERCQPHWGLGGKKPVDLLSTAMGVQAVIDLAGQIEHGVY
ncbi:antitoxin Xre/MbcA/ParS toxin-binding domain-containing protein [Aeromonas hydrophila]